VVQAPKTLVWQFWTAVEQWPTWDIDLSESALLGELAVGAQGRMKVADDAIVPFVVTELIPEERLAYAIRLFGATLTYAYAVTEEEGALKLTHTAQVKGILSFFWRLMLKAKIEKTLAPALDALAARLIAEAAKQAAAPVVPVAGEPPVAEEESGAPQPLVQQAAGATKSEEPVPAASAAVPGDPVENALRGQDIKTQIEIAAQAPVSMPVEPVEASAAPEVAPATQEPAVSDEHSHESLVPVSPVVTIKETKRPMRKIKKPASE